jgi:hypothetical protein
MTTTVVTAYFNIAAFPDGTSDLRPLSFYMEKAKPTLCVPSPMVIFCDESCLEDIKAIRGDRPTVYMVKPFFEYDFYKTHYPIIKANRENKEWLFNGTRQTCSYSLLMMFKIVAIQQVYEMDPFGSSHYAWVDFGGSHVMRSVAESLPAILENPSPKISFCYIHYRGANELTMTSRFAEGGLCGVAGGCITVEKSYVPQLYTGCMSIFYEMLTLKLYYADEQVLTYFHHRYPDLCRIYYGDYYSIITNYFGVREDYSSIRHYFIGEALHKNRRDIASECARDILASSTEGKLSLSTEDVEWLTSLLT